MKKRYLVSLIFCLFILAICRQILLVRRTVLLGKNFYGGILNNRTDNLKQNYNALLKSAISLRKTITFFEKIFGKQLLSVLKIEKEVFLVDNFLPLLPEFFSFDGEKTYFILMQNNMELRPTGGFMGSYAKLKFKNGGLSDAQFQDIYVPDGQIEGHVDPPIPIQQAFGQGWFKLRDANWDPDFPSSAKVIGWFFEKGGEEKPNGMIALNLNFVQNLLLDIGPLQLLGYEEEVTAGNLYQVAQSYSETNFFPGSAQKAGIMTALGKALLWKVKNLSGSEIIKIWKIAKNDLDEKQILLYAEDPKMQTVFADLGWDGSIKKFLPRNDGIFNDYLYLVEANLGANKANLYVEREVKQEIDLSDLLWVKNKLVVKYTNKSRFADPVKPDFWGGNYINYLRLYVPDSAGEIKAKINETEVPRKEILIENKESFGLSGIGFFVKIPFSSVTEVEISYRMPKTKNISGYNLYYQKQPGIKEIPYVISITGEKSKCSPEKKNDDCYQGKLFKDKEIRFRIGYN